MVKVLIYQIKFKGRDKSEGTLKQYRAFSVIR